MKKQYISPIVEATIMKMSTVICASVTVDNDPENGMAGEAPVRVGYLGPSY